MQEHLESPIRVYLVNNPVHLGAELFNAIRMDNGPELIAEVSMNWGESNGIAPRHIQPDKPGRNAYLERFNCTYRDEVLNAHLFEKLDQARCVNADGCVPRDYTEERPNEPPGHSPPACFRALIQSTPNSSTNVST